MSSRHLCRGWLVDPHPCVGQVQREDGWQAQAVYRLPGAECGHSEVFTTSSTDTSRRWVENCLYYYVWPFWLVHAASIFQSFVKLFFWDKFLVVYLVVYYLDLFWSSTILIYPKTFSEPIIHHHRFLCRLLTHRLYAKSEKCDVLWILNAPSRRNPLSSNYTRLSILFTFSLRSIYYK